MIYMLTASLLLLTILVIITTIRSRLRTWMYVLIIPFLIFNIGFTYHSIKELWGYPVKGFPKYEVELLAFKIEQPNVYVMVREPSGSPRLYMIPYNKKEEEGLQSANRDMRKGVRVMMKGSMEQEESRFEIYPWKPSEMMPKETK